MKLYLTCFICYLLPSLSLAQPINDICSNAIAITPDGTCNIFTNVNATASNTPTNSLSCGITFDNDKDVWFSVIVPTSGNLTIESRTSSDDPTWFSISLEAYTGSCTDLTSIACSYFASNSYSDRKNALIELEGLDPLSTIYVRAADSRGVYHEADFTICAFDLGHTTHACKIQYVEAGPATSCDPQTNTFSQEITVHYYDDGTPSLLNVWKQDFELSESPMTVTVNELSAHGSQRALQVDLVGDVFNDCRFNGRYEKNNFFDAVPNCYAEPLVNDFCTGAIELEVSDSQCAGGLFDMTGASFSSDELFRMCNVDDILQDVWFKIAIPPSGELLVDLYYDYSGVDDHLDLVYAVYDVYEGDCNGLTHLTGCGSPNKRLSNRTPGEIVFVRVYAGGSYGSQHEQGYFRICALELQADSDNCDLPTPLPISNDCDGGHLHATHGALANPVSQSSCNSNSHDNIWFSLVIPESGQVTLELKHISDGRAQFEIFESDCSSLQSLGCYYISKPQSLTIDLSDRMPNETLLIRAAADNSPFDTAFSICAKSSCPDEGGFNEVIDDQVHIKTHISLEADNTIGNTADVIYNSSGYVLLESGFEVELQGEFEALNDGCTPASLGDFVWNDDNCNNIHDEGETGIPGVLVTLWPPSDVDVGAGPGVTGQRLTDANGYYSFDELMPGSYTISLDPKDTAIDQSLIPTSGYTKQVDIVEFESRHDIDFGFSMPTDTDVTPIIQFQPTATQGPTRIHYRVIVSEISGMSSQGMTTVHVTKLTNLSNFQFNTAATTVGPYPVRNSDWQYDSSNPDFYVFTTSNTIAGGTSFALGFEGDFIPPPGNGGTVDVHVSVSHDCEINISNNNDAENLLYE